MIDTSAAPVNRYGSGYRGSRGLSKAHPHRVRPLFTACRYIKRQGQVLPTTSLVNRPLVSLTVFPGNGDITRQWPLSLGETTWTPALRAASHRCPLESQWPRPPWGAGSPSRSPDATDSPRARSDDHRDRASRSQRPVPSCVPDITFASLVSLVRMGTAVVVQAKGRVRQIAASSRQTLL